VLFEWASRLSLSLAKGCDPQSYAAEVYEVWKILPPLAESVHFGKLTDALSPGTVLLGTESYPRQNSKEEAGFRAPPACLCVPPDTLAAR
jgi:hypothetical protein